MEKCQFGPSFGIWYEFMLPDPRLGCTHTHKKKQHPKKHPLRLEEVVHTLNADRYVYLGLDLWLTCNHTHMYSDKYLHVPTPKVKTVQIL